MNNEAYFKANCVCFLITDWQFDAVEREKTGASKRKTITEAAKIDDR